MKRLLACAAVGVLVLFRAPGVVLANGLVTLARDTFSVGGPGAVMFQLMFIGVIGWMLFKVLEAVGQGQIANMLKIVTVFVCIVMVAGQVWRAIQVIGSIAGLM